VVFLYTAFEKAVISSEEKRQALALQTVRNTLQKVRDKAANAINDLLFLSANLPLQFDQVIGFTRSGRRMGKTKWKEGEHFRLIKSRTVLKRIKRGESAKLLAYQLTFRTGILTQSRIQRLSVGMMQR
jgi:hypothetical protein